MNSKRLTTFRGNISKDQESVLTLRSRIEQLLSGPSNFEEKADGRIFIKSLNKYYSPRKKVSVEITFYLYCFVYYWFVLLYQT